MAVLAGKLTARHTNCAPLAGKSTLNRLELSRAEPTRYHRISHDGAAIEALFVDLFLDAHRSAPKQIVLDLDATDRRAPARPAGGPVLPRLLRRSLLPAALRVLRPPCSAAATCSPPSCGVDFLFGLARNDRLLGEIATELAAAKAESAMTGTSARRFRDFTWRTLDSWSRARRVVAKAEWTRDEANPRFVVTSLKRAEAAARHLYEGVYRGRGEMENRIKECQLDLFADRTSAATMRANQLRLWFTSMAYVLLGALRRIGLAHTQFATATCGTIRLRLLKLGALVRVSVRRIKVAMTSACPWRYEFAALAHALLRRAGA
jgi:hypothetical protein